MLWCTSVVLINKRIYNRCVMLYIRLLLIFVLSNFRKNACITDNFVLSRFYCEVLWLPLPLFVLQISLDSYLIKDPVELYFIKTKVRSIFRGFRPLSLKHNNRTEILWIILILIEMFLFLFISLLWAYLKLISTIYNACYFRKNEVMLVYLFRKYVHCFKARKR